MASLISKLRVSTGKDSSNNFDLSCFHATTSSFYTPRITYFHEFVPGERWNMDARCSVRCLPMLKPTIADVKVHNRFFFVPYYTIMEDWNEFIAETPVFNGMGLLHPYVPMFSEVELYDLFIGFDGKYATAIPDSESGDFNTATGSRAQKYRFTDLGRTVYTILNGLGYTVNFSRSRDSSQAAHNYSALPLFAYLKVYLDWYRNTTFDSKMHLDGYLKGTRTVPLVAGDLDNILSAVTQMYLEKDYFTSSTLYPVGTNSPTMQESHTINDITYGTVTQGLTVTDSISSSLRGQAPVVQQKTNVQKDVLSKYSLDAVNALTDYVKRHQLAGLQPFNRILAEYGVTLDNEVLKRSTYIGDVVEDLNIQTVENMSYADGTALGERAGRADGGNSKKLDFSNQNFGAIVCVTTIVPRTSYVDGFKKHTIRLNRFDFFTPSVEHLGVEPVLVGELFNRFDGFNRDNLPNADAIFGYMPRYASYKTALDTISGDFAIRTRKAMLQPWLLQRVLNPAVPSDFNTISEDFMTADPSKVSNLFASNDFDNFIIFNMYHVNARLPMHQLFDDYQWSNEGDNPQKVTIENQGVQLT